MMKVLLLMAAAALSGCGPAYHPGVSGMSRPLPQNASGNSDFQPANSMPR